MFTSKSERCFYADDMYPSMAADVVEITDEAYTALMKGQATGKVIDWDDNGQPLLTDPSAPSPEFFAAIERAWRNAQLSASDGVVSRHRDEVEAGGDTTLTAEQYTELQAYRQELRKWPQGEEFPLVDHRPVAPTWLVDGEVLF